MDALPAPTAWGVTAMTVIIGLAALCLLIYQLFGRREPWNLDDGQGRLARLKKRRDRILRAMKDLELERETGAIADGEFRSLRNEFKLHAVRVTRELDRSRRSRLGSLARKSMSISPSQRKRVEAEVKTRLAQGAEGAATG